jgi:hypothetical protein
VYKSATGQITNVKPFTDAKLTKFLDINAGLSYINGYVEDPENWLVDTNTLQLVDNSIPVDYTEWMRRRRDLLLTGSDWTQGADSPLSDSKKAEWQTYRQALRDLPSDYTSAITSKDNVTWPIRPE